MLPELGAAPLPDGLSVVPLVRPTPVRTILAVVRDAAAHTPPVLAALDELRAVAGARRGAHRRELSITGQR